MKNFMHKKTVAITTLCLLSNFAFAVDIKIAFIVDNKVVTNDPTATIASKTRVIEKWIVSINEYYSNSGVDIHAQLADIRFMDVGMTDAADINEKMHDATAPFTDMRSYTDRKGADFTLTVIDGLTKNGTLTGGLAFINAEYDDKVGAALASNFAKYCSDVGLNDCFSGGSRWTRFTSKVKSVVKTATKPLAQLFTTTADLSVQFLQNLGEQTCYLLTNGNSCQVPIPNLADHKYFVGAVNFGNGAITVAHELGHMMGLIHGQHVINVCKEIQNVIDFRGYGISRYAGGWATGNCDGIDSPNDAEYGDIMSHSYNDGVSYPLFSSPNVNAFCGQPGSGGGVCGNATDSDAARALNENLSYYNKQETDVAELPYKDSNLKNCLMSKYLDNEVKGFQTLQCSNTDISSLVEIEQLTDLRNIDLSFNKLVDVKELLKLNPVTVQSLYLKGNNSILCHQVKQLQFIFGSKVTVPDSCFNIGVMIAVNSLLLG